MVRSIYNRLKQIAETVFAQSETSFDKACLVEYPRKGIWAIAFIATSAKGEIDEQDRRRQWQDGGVLANHPEPDIGLLAVRAN